MTSFLPRHLARLAARLVCAALFWQVLVPLHFAPPSFALVGADGTVLPIVLCTQERPDDGRPSGDHGGQDDHHHCLLCRLPGFASLGAGAAMPAALVGPALHFQRMGVARKRPAPVARVIRGFAARAPPSLPVA